MKIRLPKISLKKIIENPDSKIFLLIFLYLLIMIFLSSYRSMIKDEALYYRETYLISELFKSGKWIGNYSVGVHGFIFKLLPAFVFLFTGPSIAVVTIYNIILSGLFIFMFYDFLKRVTRKTDFAFLGTFFVISSFHFFLSVPTYLKEIQSLIIVVLFLNAFISHWKPLVIGFIFLLLLDVKEYLFFIFFLFYFIWNLIDHENRTIKERVIHLIKNMIPAGLPSLVWIILMFFTSIIPVNMYLASYFGLLGGGFSYLVKHFESEIATANTLNGGKDIINSPVISIPVESIAKDSLLLTWIKDVISQIYKYLAKTLYPRNFSFLSVSKVLIFPVAVASISLIKEYFIDKKKRNKILASLAVLFWVWMIFYILRISHGRYLLPIFPSIAAIMIYYFTDYKPSIKTKWIIIIGTCVYMILGLSLEESYIIQKIIIESVLFIILSIYTIRDYSPLGLLFIIYYSFISIGTSLLFSYTQGQIWEYVNWGENREVSEIARIIPNEKFWLSNREIFNVIAVERRETYFNVEWKWTLRDIVPKDKYLSVIGDQIAYNSSPKNGVELKAELNAQDIHKVVIIESMLPREEISGQTYLFYIKNDSAFKLDNKVELKNKVVYIYDVN